MAMQLKAGAWGGYGVLLDVYLDALVGRLSDALGGRRTASRSDRAELTPAAARAELFCAVLELGFCNLRRGGSGRPRRVPAGDRTGAANAERGWRRRMCLSRSVIEEAIDQLIVTAELEPDDAAVQLRWTIVASGNFGRATPSTFRKAVALARS